MSKAMGIQGSSNVIVDCVSGDSVVTGTFELNSFGGTNNCESSRMIVNSSNSDSSWRCEYSAVNGFSEICSKYCYATCLAN